jgi:PAS domain S-box-containing protein
VRVESRLGEGSTFIVSVPLGKAHLPAEQVGGASTLGSTSTGAAPFVEEALLWLSDDALDKEAEPMPREELLRTPCPAGVAGDGRPRLLVADDNADMRRYLARLLAERYDVQVVADGQAALAAARERRPDLILSDVMMPNLDGVGLLRELRADTDLTTIPVILLSARAGEESRVEGMQQGADDYVIKPFSARELLARIAARIELTRLRKEAQEALRESEKRFRALVEASSNMVYRMSADWTEMRRLMGRDFMADREELNQTWLQKYIHPDDQAHVMAVINESIRTKSIYELEHRVLRADGSIRWTHSRAVPIFDASGEITEWFGMASDITGRKQAEEALREADRRKDEFLATLAHELRNPLAPIRNGLEVLRRSAGQGETAVRVEGMMERQVDHLVRLVDDLLEVSRISRGKIALVKTRVELATVLKHAVEMTRELIEKNKLELSVAIPDEPLPLEADSVRLTQVFANLLNNAAKYTDPGGRTEIAAKCEAGQAIVSVSDTGVGIAKDMLPRVFDLFVQVRDKSDRSQGGLGIGLALVRSLVELHGGTVEAHSEGEGRGSRFIVRLPSLATAETNAQASMKPTNHAQPRAPRRVLIVDDSPDVADSLALLLKIFGAEVRVAHSGAEGLAACADFTPELVFLDIGMPVMDGFETARRMRALPAARKATLVALTGRGEEETRRRVKEAGFDRHVTKPADLDELQALLDLAPQS